MAKQTFTTGQVLTAAEMTSLQQTAMGGGSTTAKTTSYVLAAADAGTVVQMNAAGATTITVNTALFSAGDTVQIQNVGAGVCTVTAGTATVSTAGSLALSQYEGGQLYFNTTSAALFFDIVQTSGMTNPLTTTGDTIYSSSGTTPARLGIGSTGNVLTVAGGVPTWAAPAGGGKVLQVVQGTTTSQTAVATTTYITTGITATITPTLNTSKILVIWSTTWAKAGSTAGGLNFKLKRTSTYLTYAEGVGYDFSTSGMRGTAGQNYLDSPATTSATTYVVDFANFSGTDSNYVQANGSTGTITLMEIGA